MYTLNICLTSDNNYAEHMYITTFSTLYNSNKNTYYNIYIIDSKLNKKVHNLFYSLEKDFPNCHIFFIPIDEEKYKIFRSFGGTYQTYFRIDIPNLLPYLDKILYLDPDIVVDSDIEKFYNLDISNFAIAAPTETKINFIYEHILKIPSKNGFFNGGVLLINLKQRRSLGISEKLKNYLIKQGSNYFYDQDALNAILYNKRLSVPWFYNVTLTQTYKHYFNKKKAVIIHYDGGGNFLGIGKPRLPYSRHPLSHLYIKYRNKTNLKKIYLHENRFYLVYKRIISGVYAIVQISFPHLIYLLSYIQYKKTFKKT